MTGVLLAAADPGAGERVTAASIIAPVAVGVFLLALMAYAARVARRPEPGPVERWLDRHLGRHTRAALDRGDAHLLNAVIEREAAQRPAIPRQLTERSPR